MNALNAKLTEAFRRFVLIYKMSMHDRPDCPPTRDELIPAGIDKHSLQKLASMGILKSEYLPVQILGSDSVRTKPIYRLTKLGWAAANLMKI